MSNIENGNNGDNNGTPENTNEQANAPAGGETTTQETAATTGATEAAAEPVANFTLTATGTVSGSVEVPANTTVRMALKKMGHENYNTLTLRDSNGAAVSLDRHLTENLTITTTVKTSGG